MKSIIDGTLFERSKVPHSFDLRVHDLGHGHTEATVQPRYAWQEIGPVSADALAAYEMASSGHRWSPEGWVLDTPSEAEKLAHLTLNRERSTRRARTAVRRLAKFKGLQTLLTLTYRENMVDRVRMSRDFDVFMKRVRRVIPGIEYICVFERQKRGAWHAHIAVRRILSCYVQSGSLVRSYDLLRSMWRGVVGLDNGNVDVSRNKRVQRSSAKLAAYLSKYIGKTFDQAERHVNSYSASGRALPRPIVESVLTSDQSVAVGALFDLISPEFYRSEFHQAFLDGGGIYVCLSPSPS